MAENNKIYITANELAEMLGVSVGHGWNKSTDEWQYDTATSSDNGLSCRC